MIVKVSWEDNDRKYEIGVLKFLEEMGIEKTEDDLKKVVEGLLGKDGFNRTER